MNYTKKYIAGFIFLMCCISCSKKSDSVITPTPPPVVVADTLATNTTHLDNLIVPVTFSSGATALGLYIYSNAPSYTPATAPGEGFTCIDDVARGVLFYMRSSAFATDTAVQRKVFGLMQFVLSMQSANGYFYNFLQTGNVINTFGNTSVDQPKWWSWRALQALTEGEAIIRTKNTSLADKMNQATNK
ncbi:MAG: hypothetical protein ABI091_04800, partial [Ferruginibacter sp.]